MQIPESVKREFDYIKDAVEKLHKPEHKHDCDDCVFLGNAWEYNKKWDLYVHPGTNFTLIARFSSEGADYMSGVSFIGSNALIALAFVRFLAL